MTLPSFATQTAIIERATFVEDHGADRPDWDTIAHTETVTGCSIQPNTGGESNEDRNAVQAAFAIWLPAGTDVRARDRIRAGGVVYYVVGTPAPWAVGFLDHVNVLANVWEG